MPRVHQSTSPFYRLPLPIYPYLFLYASLLLTQMQFSVVAISAGKSVGLITAVARPRCAPSFPRSVAAQPCQHPQPSA